MNAKIRIYMRFLGCFLACMLLYLFSTYLKDFTQYYLKTGTKFGIMEFIPLVFVSLLNGAILEPLNKIIFEQPQKIFTMINYLILQLYLFSMILFYIAWIVNNLFGSNRLFEEILGINILVFVVYILYVWYGRKKKQEKCGRMDAIKILIGASIIFQSSIVELGFLAIYLLLLYLFTQTEFLTKLKIMFLLKVGLSSIVLIEISILMSSLNWISKLVLSVTNMFIIYVGKEDQIYMREQNIN